MIYSLGLRSTALTTGLASLTLLTAASQRSIIQEIGVFLAAAAASVFAFGRPAANGVTPAATNLFQAEDPSSVPAVSGGVLAWTTAPTAPTLAQRRWSGPATIGVGVIFTFPRGILVAVSSNYVVHNLAATVAASDIYMTEDE